MIVDTSALVAIIRGEPDFETYAKRLDDAVRDQNAIRMSAASLFELALVIDAYKDPGLSSDMDELVETLGLQIVDVTAARAALAREANRRFGRKFHPARLNFGDCFAYALATELGEPLLFKGEDFAQTDVRQAL